MTLLAAVLEWSAFLLLLPVLLLHPRVRQGIRRRLGLYDGDLFRGPGPRVWLHGASAGDVLGLVPIVRELKRLRPDARVLISA
ncbi:MAG TPA: glycosyltransferase N-terminal domain-containing protein, partial [Myxococcales bacterium]|nr:glycosyltransferase N-terminal domain-containing protein [Myxococcales bacterium]